MIVPFFFFLQTNLTKTKLEYYHLKEKSNQTMKTGLKGFFFLAEIFFTDFFSRIALKHQNMKIVAIVGNLKYENLFH